MPPRKKAKVSSASSPRDSQPKTPLEPSEAIEQRTPQVADNIDDPWTDEQETELFKSIIRFKPTASHGIAPSSQPHTRIPGIWKKLSSLYDLAALDEREYAHAGYIEPGTPSESEGSAEDNEDEHVTEFALPVEDYGNMMWQRRFAPSPSTSEPEIPNIAMGKEDQPPTRLSPSVVIDIEESQAARRGTKAGRPTRGRPATGRGRAVSTGRGGRGSKRETPQEEAEEESEEEEEDEEDEDEDTPAPAKRGRGPAKSEKPVAKAIARRSTRKR
ncbi:MAG: hypothetical protein Q9165_008594 [Trypethelium subeluteriae]